MALGGLVTACAAEGSPEAAVDGVTGTTRVVRDSPHPARPRSTHRIGTNRIIDRPSLFLRRAVQAALLFSIGEKPVIDYHRRASPLSRKKP
jgi:hypothetical protein